jgi:hypothetical protein
MTCGEPEMRFSLHGIAPACRYGGVVVRQNIAAKADWYIMEIQQFTDAVKQACSS